MEKTTPFTKQKIQEITKNYPTPFYVYDEAGIRNTARKLNAAFAWNSGYKEYFAVKALPNPFIMQILKEEGCGMDCSSLTELMLAGRVGFSGQDIMFSSNDTPAEEFRAAREMDAIINLDDITHIDFLAKNGGIPKEICCRFNPGGDFKVGNAIMGNPGDAKYGFTRAQIIEGYKRLRDMGAERFGIHTFLASNMIEQGYYPSLARIIFQLVVDIYKETGIRISFVNLSGGVGIPYRPEDKPVDIMQVGADVKREYDNIIVPAGLDPLALKTELGRFMTGPYGWLVTTVLHRKDTYKHYVGVDACAANLMRPAMYGAYHYISVLGKENEKPAGRFDVTGALCENNDKFAVDRELPETIPGDILAIHDAGAHGFAMGYNYNGRLRSAEILLGEDGRVQLIRRAETPKDYFATFDFSDKYNMTTLGE